MSARILLTTAAALLALATARGDPPADKKAPDPARYEARLAAAAAISNPYDRATSLVKIATDAAEDGKDEVVKKAMAALPKSVQIPSDQTSDAYASLLLKLAEAGRDSEAIQAASLIDKDTTRDRVLAKLADAGKTGPAAFWRACETGKDDRLTELLATVSANAKDKDGETGLMKAAANGHVAVVKKLLVLPKVELWETDAKGQTALMKAAASGQDAIVRVLLTYYMDKPYPRDDPVNLADRKGETALMLAASGGHVNVVQTLLDARLLNGISGYLVNFETGVPLADEARKDNDGKTAQELAEAGQHTGAADVLKKARKKAG